MSLIQSLGACLISISVVVVATVPGLVFLRNWRPLVVCRYLADQPDVVVVRGGQRIPRHDRPSRQKLVGPQVVGLSGAAAFSRPTWCLLSWRPRALGWSTPSSGTEEKHGIGGNARHEEAGEDFNSRQICCWNIVPFGSVNVSFIR